MTLRTDGIIIREQTTGEQDRLVTLLTRELGIIKAFVNGGRNPKNKNVSATELLCYSDFTVEKTKKDIYVIREASAKQVFFGLRDDIVRLSLAQYFAELAGDLAPREEKSDEFLSLILNSVYLLAAKKKPSELVKTVTELRICAISGYMPEIIGCKECGDYEPENAFFNVQTGCIYCESCNKIAASVRITPGVLAAMRHICLSEAEKIYSFTLTKENLLLLSELSGRYTASVTMRGHKTLDFYQTMKNL